LLSPLPTPHIRNARCELDPGIVSCFARRKRGAYIVGSHMHRHRRGARRARPAVFRRPLYRCSGAPYRLSGFGNWGGGGLSPRPGRTQGAFTSSKRNQPPGPGPFPRKGPEGGGGGRAPGWHPKPIPVAARAPRGCGRLGGGAAGRRQKSQAKKSLARASYPYA
jgi:hypothetical protein